MQDTRKYPTGLYFLGLGRQTPTTSRDQSRYHAVGTYTGAPEL